MMSKVVILGNDHTNTLGLTQTLGRTGFYVIVLMWGEKTGLVQSSKYCGEIYTASSPHACINLLLKTDHGKDEARIPIIAACDSAALALEDNAKDLEIRFVHEHTQSNYSIHQLMEKDLQVRLAMEAGFHVPTSWSIEDISTLPLDLEYPCLIKPMVSCHGAKQDIRVCNNRTTLEKNLRTLKFTKQIILQQYVDRDYEISILGCALSNGHVIIPAIEDKLTLYPKYVGLECLARVDLLEDEEIIQCIKNLIKITKYVGVFSVEMMHCKTDNKFYFTEINLRNDGANSFVYKFGVNLPLNHIEDLTGKQITSFNDYAPGYYIWDMHHLQSFIHHDISFSQWIKEICISKGFLTFFRDDIKPFFRQYSNMLLRKLHLFSNESYS